MYQKQYECIHLANPFSDKWGRWTKRRRADFDMLLKKVGREEIYQIRRKKGWMGEHVVNSWVSGSCAEDNPDWSVAAGRLTRLVAFGSTSLPRLAQSHSNRASVRVLCRPLSAPSPFGVCVCAYLRERLPRESYHVVLYVFFFSFRFALDWDSQLRRIIK